MKKARVVKFERKKSRRPKLVVQFICDHCGKGIEPKHNGMLCWNTEEDFMILHGGYCTPYYKHLLKSISLDYVSIKEVDNEVEVLEKKTETK